MTKKKLVFALAMASMSVALGGCLTSKDLPESRSSALGTEADGIPVSPPPSVAQPLAFTTYATILNQFASVTATTPSASTTGIYNLNKTSFPLLGKASELSSGMWMAVSALAGGVCNDLYVKESAQAAASRLYYGDLNLGASNNLNQAVEGSTVKSRLYRKIALGFWGRLPVAAEETELDAALSGGGFNTSTLTADETRQALLILCSGALASLSAISI